MKYLLLFLVGLFCVSINTRVLATPRSHNEYSTVPWLHSTNQTSGPVIDDLGTVSEDCKQPQNLGFLYSSKGLLVEPPATEQELVVFSQFVREIEDAYNITITQRNLNPSGLDGVRLESDCWDVDLPCQVVEIRDLYRAAGYNAYLIQEYLVSQDGTPWVSKIPYGGWANNWTYDPYLNLQVPYPHGSDDMSGFPNNGGGYLESRYAMWPPEGPAPDNPNDVLLVISDTGVYWRYPDFIANLWQNLGEDVNGNGYVIHETENGWDFDWQDVNDVDDDGDGYDDLIGYDFYSHQPDPTHYESEMFTHGTMIYGLAAEETYDGRHMAGTLFPGYVKVVPTKVGLGNIIDEAAAIEGIYYAATLTANNHRVILNMSWGGARNSAPLHQALQVFTELGGLAVAAVGNEDTSDPKYPAAYGEVLAVAASTDQNVRAWFSNFGSWCDVIAPGEGILVPYYFTEGGFDHMYYGLLDGTSFSSALVSATASMYWSMNPEVSNDGLKQLIEDSVYEPEDYPWDPPGSWCEGVFHLGWPPDWYDCGNPYYGTGIVDAVLLFQH